MVADLLVSFDPADVEAGEIAHRERAHREAEIVEHAVDVPGHRAFEDQLAGLALALAPACGCRRSRGRRRPARRSCRSCLASFITVAITGFAVFSPRTTSSSRITLAGEKKCRPITCSGPLGDRGDLVDVQVGGVGGEDRARLGDRVELAEHLLLDVHVLEHRLDDEIAVGQRVEIERRAEQAHARLDVGLLEPALLRGVLVVAADGGEAAVERVLLRFDDRHRDADVDEIHRDAAAHRAGADDADLLDRQRRRVVRHVGDLPDLALGEEHVALRRRLRREHEVHEQLALALQALVERQVHRRLDGADRRLPGLEAAELAGVVACRNLSKISGWPRAASILSLRSRTLRSGIRLSMTLRAKASAPSRSLPSSTSSSTRPIRAPAWRGTGLPDTLASRAPSRPRSMRGRRCVPPAPGSRPSLTSGSPNCADGTATR